MSQVVERIYWYLVCGILFVLVTLPGTIPAMLLERHISNAPLYALFLTVVAPALSAVLFALNQRENADGVTPAKFFFRGYRLNWLGALKVWALPALFLTILAINLSNVGSIGLGSWYLIVGVLLALVLIVWLLIALVIESLFSFRVRDVFRLATAYLFGMPVVSLGIAGIVILCALIVIVSFDAVLALVASVLVGLLLRVSGPMQEDIHLRFIQSGPGDAS